MTDIEKLFSDYMRAKNRSDTYRDTLREYDIRAYFAPVDNYNSTLASNHGQVAMNEHIEFTFGEVFCPDWVAAGGDATKAKERKKLTDAFTARLASSNFYGEAIKLFREGVMYNRGLLQTSFNNGLDFKTIENEAIYLSDNCSDAFRRAYAEKYIPVSEILETYTGAGVDELRRETDNNDSDELLMMQYRTVACIVPLKRDEDKANRAKGYKFKRIDILVKNEMAYEINRIGEKTNMFKTFPIMQYTPHLNQSLASMALPKAVQADDYELLLYKQGRKSLRTPIAMSKQTLVDNVFSLDEGGIVPLGPTDKTPTPIESKQAMAISGRDIQRQEMAIDRIFKIDLIQRAKVTNLSQYEGAANYLNAIKAIAPTACDLIYKLPTQVLDRAHSLLIQNDAEYRKLAAEAGEIDWRMSGWVEKLRRLEKAVGIGRIMQGAAPYLQADPTSAQKIDGDKVVELLGESWGVPEIVVSDEELAQERQAMQQQQQQMGETAQAQQEAELNKTQAETDSIIQNR